MKSMLGIVAVLLLGAGFGAAAKEQMVAAEAVAPPADKAVVVFMRPSSYGGLIKASVYDVTGTDQTFIGIIKPKQQIAYVVEPGERRFMVMAENGDFLDAKLDAGKTYYALVSPRMGVWKARFSLLPVRADPAAENSIASEEFARWQSKARWVARGPAADEWYAEHREDITRKKEKYLAKWNGRPAADKSDLMLLAEDGR